MLPRIILKQEFSSLLAYIVLASLKTDAEKANEEAYARRWERFVSRATKIERPFIADLKDAFRQQEKVVLDKIGNLWKGVSLDHSIIKQIVEWWMFPRDEWVEKIGTIGGLYMKEAMDAEGKDAMQGLVTGVGFDVTNPRVAEYVKQRSYKFSFDVNTETMDMLRTSLTEGLEAGESIYQIRKRVSAVFDMSSRYRAERIARTEVIRASNAGAEEAYKQSGVVNAKQWWTAQDERRCPWCAAMHGKEMGLGKNFWDKGSVMTVEGRSMKLDYDNVSYPPLHPHCYSKDTEIYTRQGWQFIKDVVVGTEVLTLNKDTQDLEWGKVIHIFARYSDDIMHILNKQGSFSMMVTADHPFFGYKRVAHDPKPRTVDPVWFDGVKSLCSEFRFYTSSRWKGKASDTMEIAGRSLNTEDYCKFMGYYLSEGSVVRRKTGRYEISIAQTDHENRETIWELVSILPFRKAYLGKEKIWIQDADFRKYLEQFGKAYEKYVPDTIKDLTPYYIRIFLDAFRLGDGNIKKAKKWKNGNFVDSISYSTSSRRLADDLGELIIKVGKSVRYRINKIKSEQHQFRNGIYTINHDVWIINELTSQYKFFRNMIVEWLPYDDDVYDVTVEPNHTILTRHNGRVVWGSNCRCCLIPVVRAITKTAAEARTEIKEIYDQYSPQIDEWRKEEFRLKLRARSAIAKRELEEADRIVTELSKVETKLEEARKSLNQQLREVIYVNKQGFDITAYPTVSISEGYTQINNALTEFSKFIDPSLVEKLKTTETTYRVKVYGERSNTRSFFYKGELHLGDKSPEIVLHEMGHLIEDANTEILEKSKQFVLGRAKQGEPHWLGNGYDRNEVGFNDGLFINAYIGKIYPNGTEVISMGLQYFYKDPWAAATKDPEYFDFIYNILRGQL